MSLLNKLQAAGVTEPPSIFLSDSESFAWLCLALTPEIGPKSFQSIILSHYSPSDVFSLDETTLKQLGIREKARKHLKRFPPTKPHKSVEQTLKWQDSHNNHHVILFGDGDYPDRLKHIATPPPVLMVKGQTSALTLNQVAVVGSRVPTAAGKQQAHDFAFELAHQGLAITSGLARGIDGAAHQGALAANGATLAVLGTGLNNIYPKAHKKLAEQITEKGALISEFPLDTQAFQGNFPRRNRIVSGLSLGTLVVEAALKSGSLITARQALEQNREVFAIPGAVSNPQKAGCHHLIRQGAVLVESADQITHELMTIVDYQQAADPAHSAKSPKSERPVSEDPHEQSLLKALDYDGASIDTLISRSGLSASELTGMLMMMEIKGWVSHDSGEYRLL